MRGVGDVGVQEATHPVLFGWRLNRVLHLAEAARFAAPFIVAFIVYLGAYLVMQPAATGDEPHYFLIAESLVFDGDVDMRNDYASRERTLAVCQCFPLVTTVGSRAQHAFRYTSNALYPWHGLGLPVLIAPAVAAGGLTAVRLLMVLLAALMADQLYRLLGDLTIARWAFRCLAWAAVVFTLPLLAFSNQILTEIPGALLVLIALRVIIGGPPGRFALVAGTGAGAALPWFQTRYYPLSIFIFLGLLYAVVRDRSPSPESDGTRRVPIHRARKVTGALTKRLAERKRAVLFCVLLPYFVSFAAIGALFKILYGSPLPDAPTRPLHLGTIGSAGWKFWYDWFLTDIFDPGIGWIPYTPVQWLGLAGLVCLCRRFGFRAIAIVAAATIYLLLVASTGIAPGTGFPARYVVTVIPLIAVPLALVIERVVEARIMFFPLFAASAVIAVAGVLDYQSLYPFAPGRREQTRLFGARSIQTAFPGTLALPLTTSAIDRPGDFAPQSGKLVNGRIVASSFRGDPPGFLIWGPYANLTTGRYRATFLVAGRGHTGQVVARLEVAEEGRVLAAKDLMPRGSRGLHLSRVVLPFATSGGLPIETRIYYVGAGEVEAGPARLSAIPGTVMEPGPSTFPDWPLVIIWVGGTILVAFLFAKVMKPTSIVPRKHLGEGRAQHAQSA